MAFDVRKDFAIDESFGGLARHPLLRREQFVEMEEIEVF